jgi:hypothetical protein
MKFCLNFPLLNRMGTVGVPSTLLASHAAVFVITSSPEEDSVLVLFL